MNTFLKKYGEWALITGATSGIGKCFAETLSQMGFNLVLVARDKVKLEKLSAELVKNSTIQCQIIVTDLTTEKSVDDIMANTKNIEISLLINNAGYSLTGNFLADSEKSQTELMKINSLIPMQLCYGFGKRMQQAKRGGIINVSSASGVTPLPGWAVYSASKAFLKSFSESLWFELKPLGIDVLALCPGATNTNFQKTARINAEGMPVQKVVQSAIKNLGKKPSVIVGSSNKFIVSFMSLLPVPIKVKFGAIAIEQMQNNKSNQ